MTEKSVEVPLKTKDAIALFESSGRPPDGGIVPRENHAQHASPVTKAGLSTEAERVQNGLPRSKNAALTKEPELQISEYRSQRKITGKHSTDQSDFRVHLKPAKCNPKTALDNGPSANSKTENKTDRGPTDRSKVSEKMDYLQGHGKTVTSSQGKASEVGSTSPKLPGKDFKHNLAKILSNQHPGTRLVSPTGQLPPSRPQGKLPKGTTPSQSTTPDLSTVVKGTTTLPANSTPPQVARAQRQPPHGAGGSASNTPNHPKPIGQVFFRTDSDGKSNSLPPSSQKTKDGSNIPISDQKPPVRKPAVPTKTNTPQPSMPKTGQNRKAADQNESGSGKHGNWKIASTQPNHSAQLISANGKKYRLLPLPATDSEARPRKPRRPPKVDLTQFVHHVSGFNETGPKVTRPIVHPFPPPIQTNTGGSSTHRPVSLIPEWTEEDEAREASIKRAQQGLNVADDDVFENDQEYMNIGGICERLTEVHSTTSEEEMERHSQIDEYPETADASDESDYETLDQYS